MGSRTLHPTEKEALGKRGIKLVDFPVAVEGIAIVVNKKNPLDEVSVGQLPNLFSGDFTNWKQLGGPNEPIRLFIRPPTMSGTAEFIQDYLLMSRPFSKTAEVRDYYEQTLEEVSKTEWGVTFAPFNKAASAKVKILRIRMAEEGASLEPNQANFSKRAYPLSRTFHLLYDSGAAPNVKEFVEYCWNRCLEALLQSAQ